MKIKVRQFRFNLLEMESDLLLKMLNKYINEHDPKTDPVHAMHYMQIKRKMFDNSAVVEREQKIPFEDSGSTS